MEQTKLILQDKATVHPITGEARLVAWFQKVRVVHKELKGEHTNEVCWCYPIMVAVGNE